MVYTDTVRYTIPDPAYSDEVWRAKHGYREEHQHNAPYRRNRDFKPVPYGTFGGMPNYRHSEAFCQMKNAKDLVTEEHHFPTRWFKQFMRGATTGVVLGSMWFFVKPSNGFAMQKLMQSVGERPWSGRVWRLFKHTAPTHALYGGSLFLGYSLILEFLRHHDETNMRPKFIDHEIAMAVIGAVAAAGMGSGSPWAMFSGVIFSTLTVGPAFWWLKM